MSEKSAREVLFRKSVRAGIALSLAAMVAGPAWAQRGQSRGGGARPPRQMQMPRGRVSPPRMPMPRPRMPRPAPMPRRAPSMRPPTPRPAPPVRRAPTPRREVHPPVRTGGSRPVAPAPAPAQPRNAAHSDGGTSPARVPVTSESARIPAYTPTASRTFKERMARIRGNANRNRPPVYAYYQPYPYPYGFWGWGGFGWGLGWGSGWNSLYIGSGFNCNPFSPLLPYWAGWCTGPASYYYGFDPFLFNFGFGLGPFSSTSLFYGPLSPAYSGPNCLLCTSYSFNPYASVLPASLQPDPYVTPLQSSSVTISNGALPGLLTAPPTSDPSLATPGGSLTGYTYATPDAKNQPVTLVLTNGTKVEATQYRLGADGSLHYVTVAGKPEAIPFNQLDMKATMKANQDKGVDFLVPKPQEPKPQGK